MLLLLFGNSQMVLFFGGDGGDVLVDLVNGENVVNEYVDFNMVVMTNGGCSDGMMCLYCIILLFCFNVEFMLLFCDFNLWFIVSYVVDLSNVWYWVVGG